MMAVIGGTALILVLVMTWTTLPSLNESISAFSSSSSSSIVFDKVTHHQGPNTTIFPPAKHSESTAPSKPVSLNKSSVEFNDSSVLKSFLSTQQPQSMSSHVEDNGSGETADKVMGDSTKYVAPYFAILGFSKCGTTFLKRWLKGELSVHPQALQEDEEVSSPHALLLSRPIPRIARLCMHHEEYHPLDYMATNAPSFPPNQAAVLEHMTNMLSETYKSSLASVSSLQHSSSAMANPKDLSPTLLVEGCRGAVMDSNSKTSAASSSTTSPYCCGYKGPVQIRRPHELALFRDYWPHTKLVIGVRHPVWWFQSIYNYRRQTLPLSTVRTIPTMSDFVVNIPSHNDTEPIQDIHKCKREICLERAMWHVYLALLGKTSSNSTHLVWETEDNDSFLSRWLLRHAKSMKPLRHQVLSPPVPNPVFLYDLSQLHGARHPTVAQALREDLSVYLQLDDMRPPAILSVNHTQNDHRNASTTTWLQSLQHRETEDHGARQQQFNESDHVLRREISICDAKFTPLRQQLVSIGKTASKWILDHFVPLPEVTISSPDFFRHTLEQWGHDPCE